jgi:hypothetical protein
MTKLILYPLALILFLLASPAWAAIINRGNLGSCSSTASGTTCAITLSASLDQHEVVVVHIGADNVGTSSGAATEVLSIVDTGGNTYERICEYRYSEGVAGDGAVNAVWVARGATALAISDTITVTFNNAITTKVVQAGAFEVTSGNKLQLAGTCKTENISDNADIGALTTDTLPSKEYLFFRSAAMEADVVSISGLTSGYSSVTSSAADGGADAASMTVVGERRILTATASTSDPTKTGTIDDGASIFVALEECTPGVDCTGDAVAAPTGQLRRRSH